MGSNHARILASLSGVDFIGVCEPAARSISESQGRTLCKNVSELIDLGIDYAVVAVPTKHHLKVCKELANSGIHALVEKPLSHNSQSAREIMSEFNTKGLLGAVGHVERYNPALQEAKKRLDQLGTLYQIATRRQGPFPGRVVDIGVVKDLATHDINLTTWITQKHYSSVSARTAMRTGRELEDLVAVIGSLSDGTTTNHLVNWLSPLKERVTTLTGEKGAFVADTLTGDLTYYANGTNLSSWNELVHFRGNSEGDVIRYAIPKYEPLRLEHESFRDALLGKHSEVVTMEDGIDTILVAEAIIESSIRNQTVELTDKGSHN